MCNYFRLFIKFIIFNSQTTLEIPFRACPEFISGEFRDCIKLLIGISNL